mmetsp:Transcript_8394/g.17597  ORF Transcript_8394/g.17597 Transcript_8394/m.17597 type:complete len:246 (-) Transcript_8394:2255-2992(-)
MTETNCLEISVENKVTCDNVNNPGICDAATSGCDSAWYKSCDLADNNKMDYDTCYSSSASCIDDSNPADSDDEGDDFCPYHKDNNDIVDFSAPRYKITIRVKPECSRCFINTANLYYYDWMENADKVDPTTRCPVPKDGNKFEALKEYSKKIDPLPKEVNLYPQGEYEVMFVSATLWCGAENTDDDYVAPTNTDDNGGLYCDKESTLLNKITCKTILKDKKVCDVWYYDRDDAADETNCRFHDKI